jgi:hypothetical protein
VSDIIYPIDRLLANPRVFFAIANALGGPDGEILKNSFYDLIEHGFADYENPDEIEFEADEICFSIEDDGTVQLTLSTGLASILKPVEGEIRAEITNDHEMSASSAIYERIVKAICTANPEFKNNIVLCSPPTPGNSYLRSSDGERFEGSFHLLTDAKIDQNLWKALMALGRVNYKILAVGLGSRTMSDFNELKNKQLLADSPQ